MASRVMHLIIANEVAKRIKVNDLTSFLLGGIAPDATEDKKITHFYTGDMKDYNRKVNYDLFLSKCTNKNSDYIKGYYTHLIADDFWLNGFYATWLKYLVIKDPRVLDLHYKDFEYFNTILKKYYPEVLALVEDLSVSDDVEIINNIQKQDLEALLENLKKDLSYNEDHLEDKLTIFNVAQIIGYIGSTVDKCVYLINQIIV